MKRLVIIAIAISASAFMCSAFARPLIRPASSPLQLDKNEGVGSVTVRVVGPEGYVHSASHWNGQTRDWGPGFSIDWGDGSFTPDDSSETNPPASAVEHTFKRPGRYLVKATTSTLDPHDRPMMLWSGEAIVTVVGPGSAAIELQILSVSGRNFPTVKWRLQTDRPGKLRFQLLDDRGQIVEDEPFDVSNGHFIDSQETQLPPHDPPAYRAALKSGRRRFTIHMILEDAAGRVLLVRRSQEFSVEHD